LPSALCLLPFAFCPLPSALCLLTFALSPFSPLPFAQNQSNTFVRMVNKTIKATKFSKTTAYQAFQLWKNGIGSSSVGVVLLVSSGTVASC
jgi:hypothetical protein